MTRTRVQRQSEQRRFRPTHAVFPAVWARVSPAQWPGRRVARVDPWQPRSPPASRPRPCVSRSFLRASASTSRSPACWSLRLQSWSRAARGCAVSVQQVRRSVPPSAPQHRWLPRPPACAAHAAAAVVSARRRPRRVCCGCALWRPAAALRRRRCRALRSSCSLRECSRLRHGCSVRRARIRARISASPRSLPTPLRQREAVRALPCSARVTRYGEKP